MAAYVKVMPAEIVLWGSSIGHCLQVTYNRLKATLDALSQSAGEAHLPGRSLTDVLFGARPPRFATASRCSEVLTRLLDERNDKPQNNCPLAACASVKAISERNGRSFNAVHAQRVMEGHQCRPG